MTAKFQPLTGRRKLLLVDCDERTCAMLTKSIGRLGMEVITAESDDLPLEADIIGVVVEIEEFRSESLLHRAHQQGLPIIALSRHETLSQIQNAIRIGATAMLNRPFTQSSVYTTLMMASGLRDRLHALSAETARLSELLRQRPQISKAVARLMTDCGIDEHEAFERIRTLSMKLNISIEAICTDIEQRASSHGVRN